MKKYWVNVTDDCNFMCSYCYQNIKQLNRMSIDTAKKILTNIDKGDNDINIIFFGGEPLLNFHVIELFLDNLKKNNRILSFGITTNLTVLTDHIIDVLISNNFRVMVSLDGDRDTYEKNRIPKNTNVDYFSIIVNNINKFLVLGYENIVFSKVITPNNINKLSHDISFLVKFKRSIFFNFEISKNSWALSDGYWTIVCREMDNIFNTYLENVNNSLLNFFDAHKNEVDNMFCCNNKQLYSECRNSSNVLAAFDPLGNIYPCHMIYEICGDKEASKNLDDLNNKLVNDSDYQILTEEQIEEVYSSAYAKDKCNNCNYFFSCYSKHINKLENMCFKQLYNYHTNLGDYKTDSNTNCLDKFIFDKLFDAINKERIHVNVNLQ